MFGSFMEPFNYIVRRYQDSPGETQLQAQFGLHIKVSSNHEFQ